MENLKSAGSIHFKGIDYSLFWDPSNGEIWFSQDSGHVRFQMAYISALTKEMVAETFIKYLKSQESD